MEKSTPKTDKELAVELTQTFIAGWMTGPVKPQVDVVANALNAFYNTLKSFDLEK